MRCEPGGARTSTGCPAPRRSPGTDRPSAAPGTEAKASGPGPDDLERWIDEYGPELERHVTGMMGDADEAQDVLQEVWLVAHRSPPDTGPDSNVRGWLYRVATNESLDRLARRRRRELRLSGREEAVTPDGPPPPDAVVEGLGDEARGEVRRCVAALPRKQREAVWMRWIDGIGYEEIARRLETSRAAARANVYQGLRSLREELSGLWSRERIE